MLTAASVGMNLVGSGIQAKGTLAQGDYAKQAGLMQQQASEFQAQQLEENAGQAIASGQRQAMDTRLKSSLAQSSIIARAAGSGTDAGVGSPAATVGAVASRGEYNALMDMFNGQSTATGLLNQAKGARYSGQLAAIGGEEAQSASRTNALATLASGAGNALSNYGRLRYPTSRGSFGA